MDTFGIRFRLRQVAEGADPWAVLGAKAYTLTEEPLQGVKIMRDWSYTGDWSYAGGDLRHRYVLYHPDHGMLGGVTLEGHGDPMDTAKTASMTIGTVTNPDVPEKHIRRQSGAGPVYDLGATQVISVLRSHFKNRYPNLRRIEAQRITGTRSSDNPVGLGGGSAQLNVQRGAGPLRATHPDVAASLEPAREPVEASPDGSHAVNTLVLGHHEWIPGHEAGDGWHTFSHENVGGSIHSDPRTGRWMHLDASGEVRHEGNVPEDLDNHLYSQGHSISGQGRYFSGETPERSRGRGGAEAERRGSHHQLAYGELARHGWTPISSMSSNYYGRGSTVWVHDSHPGHHIHLSEPESPTEVPHDWSHRSSRREGDVTYSQGEFRHLGRYLDVSPGLHQAQSREDIASLIRRVVENGFDWQELERMYGGDFTSPPEAPSTPGTVKYQKALDRTAEFQDVAKSHGWRSAGNRYYHQGFPDHYIEVAHHGRTAMMVPSSAIVSGSVESRRSSLFKAPDEMDRYLHWFYQKE